METDLEAQHVPFHDEKQQPPQDANNKTPDKGRGSVEPSVSSSRGPVATQRRHSADSVRPSLSSNDSDPSSDSVLDDEEISLFKFAEEMGNEDPPGEPWYMEMTRLRRIYFLHLNRELAKLRKKIIEDHRASKDDMDNLRDLLQDQATAIRDFQLIRSLDHLSSGQMEKRRQQSSTRFPTTATSTDPEVEPFNTENYRVLPRPGKAALEPFSDEIREFFRRWLPSRLTWTQAEREAKPDAYEGDYAPDSLSPNVGRFARFAVAMTGALFILVPMYVMALHQNRTKNLVTTTVAVVLFALLCSVTLRTSNDQTLGATAGYAAVLTVFVGLTSSPEESLSAKS